MTHDDERKLPMINPNLPPHLRGDLPSDALVSSSSDQKDEPQVTAAVVASTCTDVSARVGSCRPMSAGFDAPATHAASFPAMVFEHLNNEQAHGLVCVRVRCQADFTLTGIPAVPVGRSATTGSQVFACAPLCARAVLGETVGEQLAVACGPACCHPVTGDHVDCPGPAAGQTVVSVR